MISIMSIFPIYPTQTFYLIQIVFILLVTIFVNILFLYTVFLMIYCMIYYIRGSLNGDNKILYCNCKVTGENITLFQQKNKLKVHKIFITWDNNSIFYIFFRVFRRKQKMPKVMLFLRSPVFDSYFKISI